MLTVMDDNNLNKLDTTKLTTLCLDLLNSFICIQHIIGPTRSMSLSCIDLILIRDNYKNYIINQQLL